MSDTPVFAAVVHPSGFHIDELMSAVARDLLREGVRVRGLVQDNAAAPEGCACAMELIDLGDGRRFRISQDLGTGSTSCRIDPAGVAAATVALRRAVEEPAELVIVNRFGGLERDGGGLAADMLGVITAGIPLLTAIGERYLDDWLRFSGGLGTQLPPHREAIEGWLTSALGRADRGAPR
jgi:nucleoside-triphosphatase THEP1